MYEASKFIVKISGTELVQSIETLENFSNKFEEMKAGNAKVCVTYLMQNELKKISVTTMIFLGNVWGEIEKSLINKGV